MRLNNLTDLADLLRGLSNDKLTDGIGFDMRYSYLAKEQTPLECGTACCISGWVQHCNPELRGLDLTRTVATLLPEALGDDISFWGELYKLCYPEQSNYCSWGAWGATAKQAARAVEILRDTGKCDWDRAMQEVSA